MRRLAVTGAFAVPLSLILAGTAPAGTPDGPYWAAGTQTSSTTYAGIGGAGTFHEETVSGYHGSWWSEQSGSVAGPAGAAVLHHSESGTDDDHGTWTGTVHHHNGGWVADTDDHGSWVGDSDDDDADEVVTHTVSHPMRQHVRPAVHHENEVTTTHAERRPSRHHDHDVSFVDKTVTADVDGAASSHVASHAGHDYATYESADLAAGPGGAVSQGVKAVAVPEYAGYKSWYTAAGLTGATAHEVTSEADATDGVWTDHDGDHNWTDHDEDDD
jgi:hypothetical protein